MKLLEKIFKKSKSFSDLATLIETGNHIFFESNYFFKISNDKKYSKGIVLNVDNMIIDGQGHSIDGAEFSAPFIISAKNVVLKNIIFKDCLSHENAGVILVKENSSLKIIDCEFNSNLGTSGGVIDNFGDVDIINSKFSNNNGGTGGCIYNEKSINIINSHFESNKSNNGGVIHNHFAAFLNIEDSTFNKNTASPRLKLIGEEVGNAGVIGNFGKLKINNSYFNNNHATRDGGVIDNQKGSVFISNSFFNENYCEQNGGVIASLDEMNIVNSVFNNNSSKDGKGCIYIENSTLISNKCVFKHSKSNAIENLGIIELKGALFEDNSKNCILNVGLIKIQDSTFMNNGFLILNYDRIEIYSSLFKENVSLMENKKFIINAANLDIYKSNFLGNNINSDYIFNEGTLNIFESKFFENKSNTIIYNTENSILTLNNCNFNSNNVFLSTFYNNGKKATIIDSTFENNISEKNDYGIIINNTNLKLVNLLIKRSSSSKIHNKGNLIIKKIDETIFKYVDDEGYIKFIKPDELNEDNETYNQGFEYLNQIIDDSSKGIIILENDIIIKDDEIDFFEGGIDLIKNGLHIDGRGHIIDGNKKSRIFNVIGKDIILKDIVFKNCNLHNDFENHTDGGGVLKISNTASVKLFNCKFINCHSDDDGGVILNKGQLISKNNTFNNCSSDLFGGAIYNHGVLTSNNDCFNDINSKIATIYNNGTLTIKSMKCNKCNSSVIPNEIFNINKLFIDDYSDEILLNYGELNNYENNEFISFVNFNKIIKECSNEITLNEDVIYEYTRDKKLKEPILIENNFVINGNNHVINASNSVPFFKLGSKINVVFKNITFKNGFSSHSNLIQNINDSKVIFKKCKFINNRTFKKVNLLLNNSSTTFINCVFINNSSKSNPLIKNENYGLEFINSVFINNYSYNNSLITNKAGCYLEIKKSNIIHNQSESIDCSLIVNEGSMNIQNSIFSFNSSNVPGGVIYNKRDLTSNDNCVLKIYKSKFSYNLSKVFASVLVNEQTAYIKNTKFIKNEILTPTGASVIENYPGSYLELVKSEFIENKSNNKGKSFLDGLDESFVEGTITSYEDECKIIKCNFIKNT